jgi:hypothetical protein
VEANCHFLEFPTAKTDAPRVAGELFTRGHANGRLIVAVLPEPKAGQGRFGDGGTIRAAKSVETNGQAVARHVPLYCFRLGKCGTFMPLSRVWGESRIAVVWTWFVTVFSACSSVHFSILFTHAAVLSAVDCR